MSSRTNKKKQARAQSRRKVQLVGEVQVTDPVTGDPIKTERLVDGERKMLDEPPWTDESWLSTFVFSRPAWPKTGSAARISYRCLDEVAVAVENEYPSVEVPDDCWRAVRDFLEEEGEHSDRKDQSGAPMPKGYAVGGIHAAAFWPYVEAWLNADVVPIEEETPIESIA